MATEKPTPKAEDNPKDSRENNLKESDSLDKDYEIDDREETGLEEDVDMEIETIDGDSHINNLGLIGNEDEWETSVNFENEDEISGEDEIDLGNTETSDFDPAGQTSPTDSSEDKFYPEDYKEGYEDYDDYDDVDYTYAENRSYFFVFGPSTTGKTALLMSLYRYLDIKRIGDSFININDQSKSHERMGNILNSQFDEYGETGEFPPGTVRLAGTGSKLPIHLNYKFLPNPQLGKPGFEFCLMDMSGEDLEKIDFSSKKSLPKSISTYIEDLPKKHLRFIYVIDPIEEQASKVEQIQLFNAFVNLIDKNNHTSTPILVLVNKWDTVENYSSAKDYIESEYPKIWGQINNPERQIEFGRFSIGTVESKKIVEFDFTYIKNIFNWIYRQHTGEELEGEVEGGKKSWIQKVMNKLFN